MQLVKACVIPCPHQLPTRGGNTVLVAMVVLPPLVPPAAFATGQFIVFCVDMSVSDFYATVSQIFNVVLKVFAFDP